MPSVSFVKRISVITLWLSDEFSFFIGSVPPEMLEAAVGQNGQW